MIAVTDHGFKERERAIVSETELDSVATGATEPDAETGEADDVSDYSEEPGELEPAGKAEDVASSADGALDESAESVDESAESVDESAESLDESAESVDESAESVADAQGEPADDAREEFQRELRMLPGDWYVVHSYAGYENRVKTNLESRISSLNMEDYIYQIEVPVHQVTEIKGGKRQQVSEKVLPGYILVRMELTDESWRSEEHTS